MPDEFGPDVPDQDLQPTRIYPSQPLRLVSNQEKELEHECAKAIAALVEYRKTHRVARAFLVVAATKPDGQFEYRIFTGRMIPEVAAFASVIASDYALRLSRGEKFTNPLPEAT